MALGSEGPEPSRACYEMQMISPDWTRWQNIEIIKKSGLNVDLYTPLASNTPIPKCIWRIEM